MDVKTALELILSEHPEVFFGVMIWDGLWKAIALWHAARNNQRLWFILLVIINSAGLLPMLYLAFFKPKAPRQSVRKVQRRRPPSPARTRTA